MISDAAQIASEVLTLNKPINDIPDFLLEKDTATLHGMNLYAITCCNMDDAYWFSYLSETLDNVLMSRRRNHAKGVH